MVSLSGAGSKRVGSVSSQDGDAPRTPIEAVATKCHGKRGHKAEKSVGQPIEKREADCDLEMMRQCNDVSEI